MFSRICCFLCVLIVSSSGFAHDAMTIVERSQGIRNQMVQRGMQDQPVRVLATLEPRTGTKIHRSTFKLKFSLNGDLKSDHPHEDLATNAGTHSIKLVDQNRNVVINGGNNSTSREIRVMK